jgi:hypothetical protein
MQNKMANNVRESQMFHLVFETQIEGLLCDENPNEDLEPNLHSYKEELFKCAQHEKSPPLIEQENPCPLIDITCGSQRLNKLKGLGQL